MKTFLPFCLVALISLFLTSCVSLALKKSGVFDEAVKPYTLSNGRKQVAFIPMHHVGRPEFYASVKETVESYQRAGYQVLYESARPSLTDSLSKDTLARKLRKLMGVHLSSKGYYDSTRKLIMGKLPYKGKHSLMNQPGYAKLGVDTTQAIRADLPVNVLIDEFEREQKEIKLVDCDYETPLEGFFGCGRLMPADRRVFTKDYIQGRRNAHLATLIHQSPEDKIVVIFGKAHYAGLKKELKALDTTWR